MIDSCSNPVEMYNKDIPIIGKTSGETHFEMIISFFFVRFTLRKLVKFNDWPAKAMILMTSPGWTLWFTMRSCSWVSFTTISARLKNTYVGQYDIYEYIWYIPGMYWTIHNLKINLPEFKFSINFKQQPWKK